tara:strand:- start:15734 stop:17770 length:2037 start_codon:yes stop_codon:yes gene_type:complete
MSSTSFTNELINESSPYLLQHAHNPVNWHPWKNSVLEKALEENTLLLISVGYAACHWCHVMEHESFEDEGVAAVMNTNFINIKVDREERPDVDMVYMNAVQIMTGSGGWPMNIVALPDGRPVWGGTYFKKEDWKRTLLQIAELYEEQPVRLVEYANKLEEGLQATQLLETSFESDKKAKDLKPIIVKLEKNFDWKYGGTKHVPKFIIPSNFEFLLKYSELNKAERLKEFTALSLQKISFGGIYDHIQGGFSRYSVDAKWHIPHFEKMLYDNAQLISLYSNAYAATQNEWYKEVITQTLNFVKNELTSPNVSFYASLDADSLNLQGKLAEGEFYVWNKPTLKEMLQEEYELFEDYYNINSFGKWEDENYVLIRSKEDEQFISEHTITSETFKKIKNRWQSILGALRATRNKPRLDDKQLTSWNAMMLSGYLAAYRCMGTKEYFDIALLNAEFIKLELKKIDGNLHHSFKNGKSTINGYLEDYAFVIKAFIELYEATLNKQWLLEAKDLMDYTLSNFQDPTSGLFFFTSKKDRPLITRNFDLNDNVIPSSNSVMANNLFKLSKHFENSEYLKISEKMLDMVNPQIKDYPQGYSNWLNLRLNFNNSFYEVVVMGPNAKSIVDDFNRKYLPNILIAGSETEDESLPLLKHRYKDGEDLIYVCTNGTCQLPVKTITSALKLIK